MAEAGIGLASGHVPAPSGVRVGHLVNVAGAIISVALLAGTAWWGYRLAVRDVSGVPVLRAMQGPMRVVPADPGGQIAVNTGLAVNTVIATGRAEALPERVALAPPPVALAPEDILPAAAPAAPLAPPAAEPAVLIEALPAAVPLDPAAAMDAAVEAALSALSLDPEDSGPGLARSPRPRPRAAPVAASGELAALGLTGVETVAARRGLEIDPATLRPGTRLAQLGAYDDAEAARAEWDRIAARAGALMEGKARVLQPATSAGRDFIRLRVASFASEDEARRFCTAIESGDLRCIPVTHR